MEPVPAQNGVGGRSSLRVLVTTECPLDSVNGVTRSVRRSVDHLCERGHTVLVVAPAASRTVEDWPVPVVEIGGVPLPRYPSLRVGLPGSGRLSGIVQGFRPDVVHLAAPVLLGDRMARIAARAAVPSVGVFQTDLAGFVAEYGWMAPAARPIWRWLRSVHDRTDLTLAPTPTVARDLGRRGFRPVEVWGRGVDRVQFDPSRRSDELRRRWRLDGRPAVGFVGRLAAEKRVERLAPLAGRRDLRLVIVGDGPIRHHLERELPEAVFTGQLIGDELGAAMASLDVFVHTGEHETFCQTVQEAMAAQVAVVAPAAGGPIDLVDHGTTGRLFRPGDDADLIAQVLDLIGDPRTRLALARAGHHSVRDRSWSSIGDELIAHYRRTIAWRRDRTDPAVHRPDRPGAPSWTRIGSPPPLRRRGAATGSRAVA